jgi:hypothetical protein
MGKRNVNALGGEGVFGESRMHASLMEAISENGGVPCESNPEIFFPEQGDTKEPREAKALCRSCPVIDLCGEYAVRFNMTDGIWGGFTPSERRAIRLRATTGKPVVVSNRFPKRPIDPYNGSNAERTKLAGLNAVELLPLALDLVKGRVPKETRLVAEARLKHPEMSLKQIGELFDPPISKDVVAGRLRRLLAVARTVA